jgi:hypothetical protein
MLDLAKSNPLSSGMGCAKCGVVGLHSCLGFKAKPPSAEDEARLSASLCKAFGPFASDRKEETDVAR